jgi:hypothetical protein
MKYFMFLVVALMLMVVPAFADQQHNDPPQQLNGEAAVTSTVGGFVQSGNITHFIGGSFAKQTSTNTSIAGFDTYKNGNVVEAMTFGSSIGSTFGLVLGTGVAGGFQAGTYSASSWMSIPKPHGN